MEPVAGGEGSERRHRPGGIAHIEPLQVFGQHAVGGVGLDVDPLHPSALDEVVDIGAAEGRRDSVVDGADGNPQGARLFPIHVDAVLGHIFQAVGADTDQPRVPGGHAEHLVAGRHQGFVSQTAPVLQLKVKPARLSKLKDCRRREGEHPGVADLRELSHGASHHGINF